MFAQYSSKSFDSWVVFGKNTKGGLFDLVLFTNRSCLLIDFVSNTM